MPARLSIDPKVRMVYSSFDGHVTTADLMKQIEAISKHPDFNPDFDELIDARGITSLDVPSDVVREFALRESPFHPVANRVLVAPQDLVYGVGRMFQTLGSERRPHFAVVRTLDEAFRRLGLEGLPKAQ